MEHTPVMVPAVNIKIFHNETDIIKTIHTHESISNSGESRCIRVFMTSEMTNRLKRNTGGGGALPSQTDSWLSSQTLARTCSLHPHLFSNFNFPRVHVFLIPPSNFLPSWQRACTPQYPSLNTLPHPGAHEPTPLRPLFFIEQESNYLTQIQVPHPLWPSTLTSLH